MLSRLRCGVGLSLMSLGLSGCFPAADGQLDEQKNPYFIAGKERVAARDYKGAIEAFEKALEVNPRSALAHYELGVLYEQRENDYPAAIYHYNKVLKLRPSGAYPAENALLRVRGCKQEMVYADKLEQVNPSASQELDRLRDENQLLRKQLESLQARFAAKLSTPARPAAGQDQPASPAPWPASGLLRTNPVDLSSSPGSPPPRPQGSLGIQAAAANKTHKVKPNETLFSIARQYGVKLESLMAVNPNLVPTRVRVGQNLNIPSS